MKKSLLYAVNRQKREAMKTTVLLRTSFTLGMLGVLLPLWSTALAGTTINATNHYAWAANTGWIESRGDVTNGLVIGEYVCAGYIYGANIGWINFGSGTPTNGIAYQNLSADDFGVNLNATNGNLRGYAYGANIGWINFEDTGAPAVNLLTGALSGYAYGANIGWISLSNAFAFVQTDSIQSGLDSRHSGLPDAWQRVNFEMTGISANADADGDGMSNLQEYRAGTDPNDANDTLRFVDFMRNGLSQSVVLQWSAKPTRYYVLEQTKSLTNGMTDFWNMPMAGWNNLSFTDTNSASFYRVRAYRPLMP